MPRLFGDALALRGVASRPLGGRRQFDVPEHLWIARQAAEALDGLHAAGLDAWRT